MVESSYKLYTVFVNNLSRRVTRSALWEAFEAYGRVADMFISFHSKRPFCFAFVRYRSVDECIRVVRGGNRRRIDGQVIMVKEASFGWKERCSDKELKSHREGTSSRRTSQWRVRDNRTFKEALMGAFVRKESGGASKGVFLEEIFLGIDIPTQETEWLSHSVFAATKDSMFLDDVTEFVSKLGSKGMVSPIGGISVCVTFDSQNARDEFSDKIVCMENSPLFDLQKWNGNHQKLIYVWVLIEDVPFHLWNVSFFEQLGNTWSSFMKTDECTMKKSRLDRAKILIKMDTQLRVPSMATVVVHGEKFKISVALEEGFGAEYKIMSSVNNDGTQVTGCLLGLEGQTKSQKKSVTSFDKVCCMGSDRVPVWEFSQLLNENELRGLCWQLVALQTRSVSPDNRRSMDHSPCASNYSRIDILEVGPNGQWAIQVRNVPVDQIMFSGENEDGLGSPNRIEESRMDHDYSGSQFRLNGRPSSMYDVGCNINSRMIESPMVSDGLVDARVHFDSYEDEEFRCHYRTRFLNREKNETISCRRKGHRFQKGARKSIREVMRVFSNSAEVLSGTSLSDDDIIHRNKVILFEPEVVSDISYGLGLVFDENRDGLVEYFANEGVQS
ncbi:hypothetical protein PTKIN_Ptkin06aG0180600 [Pterospermum kingtungense]